MGRRERKKWRRGNGRRWTDSIFSGRTGRSSPAVADSGTIRCGPLRRRAAVRAACLLFDDRGQRVARYDKVHLFDVQVVGSRRRYEVGHHRTRRPCFAERHWVGWGWRCAATALSRAVSRLMDAAWKFWPCRRRSPAATGLTHWETLCCGHRAIENQCCVIALRPGRPGTPTAAEPTATV